MDSSTGSRQERGASVCDHAVNALADECDGLGMRVHQLSPPEEFDVQPDGLAIIAESLGSSAW